MHWKPPSGDLCAAGESVCTAIRPTTSPFPPKHHNKMAIKIILSFANIIFQTKLKLELKIGNKT